MSGKKIGSNASSSSLSSHIPSSSPSTARLSLSFTPSSSSANDLKGPYVYVQWLGLAHTEENSSRKSKPDEYHVLALCRKKGNPSTIVYLAAFKEKTPLKLVWGQFSFEKRSEKCFVATDYENGVAHEFQVKSDSLSWSTFVQNAINLQNSNPDELDHIRNQLPWIETITPHIEQLIHTTKTSSFNSPSPSFSSARVMSGSKRGQSMVKTAVVGSVPSAVKLKTATNYANTTSSPPRERISSSNVSSSDYHDPLPSTSSVTERNARDALRRQEREKQDHYRRQQQLRDKLQKDSDDRDKIRNQTNLLGSKSLVESSQSTSHSRFSSSSSTYRRSGTLNSFFPSIGSSSPSLSSPFSSSYRSSAGGFKNVGNSCYINAVLQALLGIPCFQQSLEDPRLTSARHMLNRELAADSVYRTLLNMSLQKNKTSQSNESAGAIDTRTIKDVLGKRNKLFSGYSQQDAHEFFNECLNFLHADVRDSLLTDQEFAKEKRSKEKWERKVEAAANKVEHRFDSVFDEDDFPDEEEKFSSKVASNVSANASATTIASPLTAQMVAEAAFGGLSDGKNDAAEVALMDFESENAIIPATPSDESDDQLELEQEREKDQAESKACDRQSDLDELLESLSPVSINFQCIVTCSLTCVSCGEARNVLEEFHDFSVDLPEKPRNNNLITNTFKPLPTSPPAAAAAAAATSSASKSISVRAPLASSPTPVDKHSNSSASGGNDNGNRASTETKFIFADPASDDAVDLTVASPPATPIPESKNAFTHLEAGAKAAVPIHLTKLVQQFFQPIVISYKCKCGGTELARTPKIKLLPRVLVLHLKRFQYNEFTRSFQKRKDNINFGSIIDMTPFVADEVELPTLSPQEQKMIVSNKIQQQMDETKSPQPANRKRKSDGPSSSPSAHFPSNSSSNKLAKYDVTDLQNRETQRYDDEREVAMERHLRTCTAEEHDGCVALGEALSKVESDHEGRLNDIRSKQKLTPTLQTIRSIAELDDDDDENGGRSAKSFASSDKMSDGDDDEELRRAIAESKKQSLQTELKVIGMSEEEQLKAAIQASMQEQASAVAPVTVGNKGGIQHTYKLISVIIHKGETASSGHYVSQILEENKSSPTSSSSNSNATSKSPASSSPIIGSKPSSQSPKPSSQSPPLSTSPLPKSSPREVWKEYDDAYVRTVRDLTDLSAKQAVEKEGYIFFYVYQPTTSKSLSSKKK